MLSNAKSGGHCSGGVTNVPLPGMIRTNPSLARMRMPLRIVMVDSPVSCRMRSMLGTAVLGA